LCGRHDLALALSPRDLADDQDLSPAVGLSMVLGVLEEVGVPAAVVVVLE
jgi:hypothetical protein